MQLQITLMKTVPDEDTASALVAIIREKLADNPEVSISANLSTPVLGQ